MSTILTEGDKSFFFTTPARVVDGIDDRDTASDWASNHIVSNKAIKWIIGKYVEADNPNSNGQMWSLEDLRLSQPTIQHSPMNLAHRADQIVGTFVASELIYPTDSETNPYIETVAAYWKYYFPNELTMVEAAYSMGALYQSMECVAESVTCAGPNGCGETFAYAGPMDAGYCEHIRDRSSYRQLNKPHFLAGGLIYPPDRPGWKRASIDDMAHVFSEDTQNDILRSIAVNSPELSPSEWENLMFAVMEQTIAGWT